MTMKTGTEGNNILVSLEKSDTTELPGYLNDMHQAQFIH